MPRIGSARGRAAGRRAPEPSGRYTPPVPRNYHVSPPWVPAFMISALVCGAVVIMTGYFAFDQGGTQLLLLLVGAAFVAAGFMAAMRYR